MRCFCCQCSRCIEANGTVYNIIYMNPSPIMCYTDYTDLRSVAPPAAVTDRDTRVQLYSTNIAHNAPAVTYPSLPKSPIKEKLKCDKCDGYYLRIIGSVPREQWTDILNTDTADDATDTDDTVAAVDSVDDSIVYRRGSDNKSVTVEEEEVIDPSQEWALIHGNLNDEWNVGFAVKWCTLPIVLPPQPSVIKSRWIWKNKQLSNNTQCICCQCDDCFTIGRTTYTLAWICDQKYQHSIYNKQNPILDDAVLEMLKGFAAEDSDLDESATDTAEPILQDGTAADVGDDPDEEIELLDENQFKSDFEVPDIPKTAVRMEVTCDRCAKPYILLIGTIIEKRYTALNDEIRSKNKTVKVTDNAFRLIHGVPYYIDGLPIFPIHKVRDDLIIKS